MSDNISSNIWKYYLLSIFTGIFFFLPIIVLFWQENGLSLTQIMILQSLFSVTTIVLEVPSGYLADQIGRKKSLMISGVFIVIGVFLYGLGRNFMGFLIAEILWAVGSAFLSGTGEAFLFDTLKDLKREKDYKKIFGNGMSLSFISLALSNVIGGVIAKTSYRLTFFITLPFMFLYCLTTFILKEPRRHKKIIKKDHLKDLFSTIKSTFEHKKLKWLIIYFGITMGLGHAGFWFFQPYFKSVGIDIVYFGIIFFGFNLAGALSSKYAHKIEKFFGEKYSLIMIFLLTGFSYLAMSSLPFFLALFLIVPTSGVWSFGQIVISDYVNKLIKSEKRATIISIQNMAAKLLYALVIPFFGMIADVYTIFQALLVMGLTTLIAGLLLMPFLFKHKLL